METIKGILTRAHESASGAFAAVAVVGCLWAAVYAPDPRETCRMTLVWGLGIYALAVVREVTAHFFPGKNDRR